MATRDILVAAELKPRPDGWDPRQLPVRHCPIHLRLVHVDECCPMFCGAKHVVECKYADRDPRPEEMQVATVRVNAEGVDVGWVQRWRKEHSPLLKGGR